MENFYIFDGNCFKVFKLFSRISYNDAKELCNNENMELFSPRNIRELYVSLIWRNFKDFEKDSLFNYEYLIKYLRGQLRSCLD